MDSEDSKITIKNINEAFVKIDCEEGLAHEIKDAFTFHVPGYQFTPQYRAKLWDGKIRLFNITNKQIYRGLVPHIFKICKDRGYRCDYENEEYNTEFSVKEAQDFIKTLNIKYTPRDYQVDSFVYCIRNRRVMLLSPTSSGKSLIIYLILRYLHDALGHRRTLIIVPNISLVSQLATDFADYGFDSNALVHRIYSGQDKQSDCPITISTWQSLYKVHKEYFRQFDAVIGDEAHLFKAKSLTDIMTNLVNAKYRIGTTGTLDGTKTHKLVLEGLFGPVKKSVTTKELMDAKHIADMSIKCLLLKHPDDICKMYKDYTYQQEIEYLVLNEARNKFIINLASSLNGNTLILYQYVEKHGKILYDILTSNNPDGRKIFFIHGNVDVDTREEIRQLVETETNAIIVASFGVYSTGVNIKNLHNIIFASPSKSRVRNLQSIGRGLRLSQTKTSAVLFDIADDMRWKKHENYTLKHFSDRIKIYAEEKFSFKVYKIELKK
jgi:superfamily II DNA or RNA helicase